MRIFEWSYDEMYYQTVRIVLADSLEEAVEMLKAEKWPNSNEMEGDCLIVDFDGKRRKIYPYEHEYKGIISFGRSG